MLSEAKHLALDSSPFGLRMTEKGLRVIVEDKLYWTYFLSSLHKHDGISRDSFLSSGES
jgi:hypothetical protein